MGALVPIAGGAAKAAGAVPALRVIQGGAVAAAAAAAPVAGTAAGGGLVGAAGAVGGVVGPVAAVLGAFALGFEAGKLLLAAWSLLNRVGGERTLSLDNDAIETWPLPNTATGLSVSWVWRSPGYGDSVVRDRIYGTSTHALPFVFDVVPDGYYGGLDDLKINMGTNGAISGGAGPGAFRLLSVNNPSGGPVPPRTAPGDPAPPRSGPLQLLQRAAESVGVPLPAPLAFVPPAQPAIAPAPTRKPVVVPQPIIPPAPVPSPNVPAGVPGPSPGPGTIPQITPAPGTAPAPAPLPSTFPQVDPARPPVPIGPSGVPVTPAPSPVPVTPPDIVIEGGVPIGDAAARPRPELGAIASELGRQEQKLASLLGRTGADGQLAATLRKLIEDMIRDLFNDVPGGQFLLQSPCPPPGGQGPPPPVVVPYEGGTNAAVATLRKLDGIAALIQAHKDMGQPTCRTPVVGQEVTVHFEGG